MEARVRAALLRLWKTTGEHVAHRAWTSDDVAREVLDDGKGGVMRFLKLTESVQRIGRNVAKGKGFNCSPSGWSELEDGIEFTYKRGDFIVRRARSSKPVAREARKRAQPRWQPEGGNSFAEPPRPPREYHLYGDDVPRLCVHHLHYEAPDVWFVSCHPWGIENVRLKSVDPKDAKCEAIEAVADIMRERLDAFVRVTEPLVAFVADPPFDTTPSGKVVVNGGRR